MFSPLLVLGLQKAVVGSDSVESSGDLCSVAFVFILTGFGKKIGAGPREADARRLRGEPLVLRKQMG